MTVRRTLVVIICLLWPGQLIGGRSAAPPLTGTFEITFIITLKSPTVVAPHDVVTCEADASLTEVTNGPSNTEKAIGIATGSGDSWTCHANMNYSWSNLVTPTTDVITLYGKVDITEGYAYTATNNSAATVVYAPLSTHHHEGTISFLKGVPTGTTSETVDVTL